MQSEMEGIHTASVMSLSSKVAKKGCFLSELVISPDPIVGKLVIGPFIRCPPPAVRHMWDM